MATTCDLNKEPEIIYPNFWEYKIIVLDSENAQAIVQGVVGERQHKITPSKSSKEGKYKGYNLSVLVNSNQERLEIFSALRRVCKYVL
ncbi:HP0495 family protein [Campylobacter showae]|uniref:Proposed lipoate regulatory protein YbeD n=1 Tax=Campylobacter showae CSUNSWCD TaxID=1244083 RepID=M5IRU4_9BACT|nr:DUF493 domain-containing protein [Campylobacter showae]EKU11343.1 hypothetical protein CSUNSWCD_1969 [Campylobacter showae CSUNSWCD]